MAINRRHTKSSRRPSPNPPPAVKRRRAADQDATWYSGGKEQVEVEVDIEDEVSREQEEYDSTGSDESCEDDLAPAGQQLCRRPQSKLKLAAANMARNATHRGQAYLVWR